MTNYSAYEIPLQASPQSFPIALNGANYTLLVIWNVQSQSWIMDIGNSAGEPLAQGLPLLPGVDILGQLQYIGIGARMIVQSDFDPYAPPTLENLGQQGGSHLYILIPAS